MNEHAAITLIIICAGICFGCICAGLECWFRANRYRALLQQQRTDNKKQQQAITRQAAEIATLEMAARKVGRLTP